MELKTWQISDNHGNSATILNFGARLINWQTEASQQQNIVVGYPSLEDYLIDGAYMGAVAGPFANRIGGASFQHQGKSFQLGANEGDNHLHGGADGLEKVYWHLVSLDKDSITLSHAHRPGADHIGYPGHIDFQVIYKIEPDNGLSITLSVEAQQPVPIGPTGHAYFNLESHTENINQHQLQINASQYTPVDGQNIPTGKLINVPEAFDFQEAKRVEVPMDNNFVIESPNPDSPVARLTSEKRQLQLEVFSDYPGVQIYTADHMSAPFIARNAICIEPQFYPDSPNKPEFPFELTGPDNPFCKVIRYKMTSLQ